MVKYIVLVIVLVAAVLLFMYIRIGVPKIYSESPLVLVLPHHFLKPEISLENISIRALYFVPKNKNGVEIENWREILEDNLKKLAAFHVFQLQGRSQIIFRIYPQAVVGKEEQNVYDTDVTNRGNPEALKRVALELEERLKQGGDLYRLDFLSQDKAYNVTYILYEGVGASGSDNIAFISRAFFTDPQYDSIAASLFAHEFYHTLGLPDAYDDDGVSTGTDLLGLGRFRPLNKTYLSREFLAGLGF